MRCLDPKLNQTPERRRWLVATVAGTAAKVSRRPAQKGLAKNDVVVPICRSGDRSSRGADRLADDGDTRVWSVVDGFEGDMGKDGRRSVNGWKNAGLPWSDKLERDRMDFPR